MIAMRILFHKASDPPLWPQAKAPVVDAGILTDVAVLDEGMVSGLPSVMFRLQLPDGTVAIAQQTARQMVVLGRLINARYPGLMEGGQ